MVRWAKLTFVLGCMVLAAPMAFSQGTERAPCRRLANGDLYQLSRMLEGDLLDTTLQLMYWDADGHATSILPPDSGSTDSCLYGPERAVDGDPMTAWCEGIEGNGEGEVIVVHLGSRPESVREIEIWAGFGRSASLHARNGRPRTIRIHVLQALTGLPNQYDTTMGNFVKLAERIVHLDDLNGYQRVALPSFEPIRDRAAREEILDRHYSEYPPYWLEPVCGGALFAALEIVEVYPGTSWEDTLISEVRPIVR